MKIIALWKDYEHEFKRGNSYANRVQCVEEKQNIKKKLFKLRVVGNPYSYRKQTKSRQRMP